MMNLHHYGKDRPRPPSWIREGLAEYDGYMHTTPYNKNEAIVDLIAYVDRHERGTFACCSTLGEEEQMSTTSVYYGGALAMLFLAERLGEGNHVWLFRMTLNELLMTKARVDDSAVLRRTARLAGRAGGGLAGLVDAGRFGPHPGWFGCHRSPGLGIR